MKKIKNAHEVAVALMQSGRREVEFVADVIEVHNGETLVVHGDISGDGEVVGTGAVVVEGQVIGREDRPCKIATDGPVVVMGNVRHARIQGYGIYLHRSVRTSQLVAEDEVHINEDAVDTKIHIGDAETLAEEVASLQDIIRVGRDQKQDLQHQLQFKKSQLNKLLQTTGLVFNLNIGQIVRNTQHGLVVDLTSFYNALGERSEKEIDQALREFFAKAVVGLLTQLNQSYIAQGPRQQKGFGGVVLKLQELILLTRELDKVAELIEKREKHFWHNLKRFNKTDGTLCVMGAVLPGLDLHFSRLEKNDSSDVMLHKFEMILRKGNRKGYHEAVLKYNNDVVDMMFVQPDVVQQVSFFAPKDRIMWASNASDARSDI